VVAFYCAAALVTVGSTAPADVSAQEGPLLLARQLLQHAGELELSDAQVVQLEQLIERWTATDRALSLRAPQSGIVSPAEKSDALLIWQERSRQRVLVDREALLVLTPRQRQTWKRLNER